MKTISVFNQKGGVGKTTTAINLSAGLARRGHRVLLIDLDSQASATIGLGIEKYDVDYTMLDIMLENVSIEDAIVNPIDLNVDKKKVTEERVTISTNLNFIGANRSLIDADINLIKDENGPYILREKLKSLDYDYCIIDCAPGLGLLTINALSACEYILAPLQAEFYALDGVTEVELTKELISDNYNSSIDILGYIVTMFRGNENISKEALAYIKKNRREKLFKTTIPKNAALGEAPLEGLPICLLNKHCKGAIAYEEMVDEFLERIDEV